MHKTSAPRLHGVGHTDIDVLGGRHADRALPLAEPGFKYLLRPAEIYPRESVRAELAVGISRRFVRPNAHSEVEKISQGFIQRDGGARQLLGRTRQDDRHLSNIAIKMSGVGESFYPLYDNGRSLFYEDTEEMVEQAAADPEGYATSFGYAGTYWDYVREIAEDRGGLKGLINLDTTKSEIADILKEAGFKGYRFDGALAWILKTIGLLKNDIN